EPAQEAGELTSLSIARPRRAEDEHVVSPFRKLRADLLLRIARAYAGRRLDPRARQRPDASFQAASSGVLRVVAIPVLRHNEQERRLRIQVTRNSRGKGHVTLSRLADRDADEHALR